MIRSILIVLVALTCFTGMAQQRTSSPYSFFGLGQQTFKGTIENRSMGGIRTYSDSIHVNLRNPASYGNLRLTTYTVGAVHTETWAETNTASETYDNTTIEYISIGVPVSKKAAFGFGLVPFQSVGYELGTLTEDTYTNFNGEGSLNRAYFGIGYQPFEGFNIGGELRYNFGEEINSSSVVLADVQYGTNEVNETDFSGVSYNFGLHYNGKLSEKYEFQASATYSPESNITGDNNRILSTITLSGPSSEVIINSEEFDVPREKFKLPSEFSLGFGIGERLKWFAAAEYTLQGTSTTTNRSFAPATATFTDAASYKLGGYYIPDYNSISSYWKRATYRAGLRFEETGLQLNGEDITEFGISFGIGIPVGQTRAFSNANIGFEYGQRGTTSNGLVKEDFFSISLGLSLNDRWFQKRKYN
ncbi:hypothetical protein BST92_08180 [Nonlabens arenilitoris]|uniref:Outer membrane protein n=1 Tax=Nonlabens arenilitoris TaxID=1217969 RepID=A0A2S7UAF4_9FLAO|nr:hypothetical protein [Nonlabens arenilitoris]PQJ31905.1 hypothetical protein BST92_08180 [Nonlabens arenilitoris]